MYLFLRRDWAIPVRSHITTLIRVKSAACECRSAWGFGVDGHVASEIRPGGPGAGPSLGTSRALSNAVDWISCHVLQASGYSVIRACVVIRHLVQS